MILSISDTIELSLAIIVIKHVCCLPLPMPKSSINAYLQELQVYFDTLKNKGALLASMALWRTLNIFQMQKRFFR